MSLTAAERQQARRQRQADHVAGLEARVVTLHRRAESAEAGHAAVLEDNERLRDENERLEAERTGRPVARCDRCRADLACPRCDRGEEYA